MWEHIIWILSCCYDTTTAALMCTFESLRCNKQSEPFILYIRNSIVLNINDSTIIFHNCMLLSVVRVVAYGMTRTSTKVCTGEMCGLASATSGSTRLLWCTPLFDHLQHQGLRFQVLTPAILCISISGGRGVSAYLQLAAWKWALPTFCTKAWVVGGNVLRSGAHWTRFLDIFHSHIWTLTSDISLVSEP